MVIIVYLAGNQEEEKCIHHKQNNTVKTVKQAAEHPTAKSSHNSKPSRDIRSRSPEQADIPQDSFLQYYTLSEPLISTGVHQS